MLLAGLSIGLVACGDDGAGSPERVVSVQDVGGPIVALDDSIWVTAGDQAIQYDATTREQGRLVELQSTAGASFQSAAGALWMLEGSRLERIEPTSGAVSGVEAAFDSVAAVGDRLFGVSGGDLHEIDPATGDDLGVVTLPLNENGFDYEVVWVPLVGAGDTLWVTVAEDDFSFTAFDPEAGTFGPKVEVDETFGSAVLVGDVIWLADRYGHAVIADAATGEVLDDSVALPVGETILDEAGSLFVGADGTLWLLDQPAQNVYQLDPHTGAGLGTFHLRLRPSALAATATELWITNPYDDSLTVLPRSALQPPAQS